MSANKKTCEERTDPMNKCINDFTSFNTCLTDNSISDCDNENTSLFTCFNNKAIFEEC